MSAANFQRLTLFAGQYHPGSIPPKLNSGLVLVTVDNSTILPHARVVLEKQAREGGQKLGVTMPSPRPVFLMSGNAIPEREPASRGGTTEISLDSRFLKIIGRIKANPKTWLTAEQPLIDPRDRWHSDGFRYLRQTARKHKTRIMIFCFKAGQTWGGETLELMDEHIHVQCCEPEPGANASFAVTWCGTVHPAYAGCGSVMCSVYRDKNGTTNYRGKPFISAQLSSRVMWMLRCEGESHARIAARFGMAKSTVQRRLEKLPATKKLHLSENWLALYADVLGLKDLG